MKTDDSNLKTHKIIISIFLLDNKVDPTYIFKKTVLLVINNIKIVFEILCLILSNINVYLIIKSLNNAYILLLKLYQ